MRLKGIKVGIAMTGAFSAFKNTIEQIENMVKQGAEVIPIMSLNAYEFNTKFGDSFEYIKRIEEVTNKKVLCKIQDAELIGPKQMTDILIVAPTTGNTIAKIAWGINDTVVTMAVKSHLRNRKSNCYSYCHL